MGSEGYPEPKLTLYNFFNFFISASLATFAKMLAAETEI